MRLRNVENADLINYSCIIVILVMAFSFTFGFSANAEDNGAAAVVNHDLALCVGASNHQWQDTRSFCVNNALAIRDRFMGSGRFRRVKFLVDELGEDEQRAELLLPTRENILNNVRQTAAVASPEANLYFYYSGFGVERAGEYCLAARGENEHGAIPLAEILDIMRTSRAKRKVVVIDASKPELIPPMDFLTKETNIGILMANGDGRMSDDGGEENLSLFTRLFLQGISGPADADGDGVVGGEELRAWIDTAIGDYCLDNDIFDPPMPALNAAGAGMPFFFLKQDATATDAEVTVTKEKESAKRGNGPVFKKIGGIKEPPIIKTDHRTAVQMSDDDSGMSILQHRWAPYMHKVSLQLQESLNRQVILSPMLLEKGKVKIRFGISPSGALSFFETVESSYGESDSFMISLAERVLVEAAPFVPLTPDMQEDANFQKMTIVVHFQ